MRVLILGYGKMGRIHAKHLTELGVPWDYHDPHLPGGVGLDRLADCTHAIIATPIDTRYDVYRSIDGFPGRILIEKPVVTRAEQLHVLDDPRVFPGMCERFNSAVIALRRMVNPDEVVALEFCRTTRTGDVADVGIHDLDLFCHLCCLRRVPAFRWDGDVLIAFGGRTVARFRWPVSDKRRRTLSVVTVRGRIEVDLVGQTINGRPLVPAFPVLGELTAFLSSERLAAAVSHALLSSVLNRRSQFSRRENRDE